MKNLYEILGVSKDASQSDIKSAYRKLAKALHPDLNPSDPKAEARFKEVSAAFDILGDQDKRAKYDRGEIDASGQERKQHDYYKQHADAGGAQQYGSDASFEDLGDIFAEMFRREGGADGSFQIRGGDVRYHLAVDFMDAAKGAAKRISLPDGSALNVKVPVGVKDGQIIRLRGKGRPGRGGGPSGDAYIEIAVREHKMFRREQDDIIMDLPISIDEAVLGGKVEVQTLNGRVRVTVPKGSSTGQILRLKGKGVKNLKRGQRGDQKCILKIILPDLIDPDLEALMTNWRTDHAYNPRESI